MTAESALGIPRQLDRGRAEALASEMARLWQLQTGNDPGGLEEDLTLLKHWFDPVASGERLRGALADAPSSGEVVLKPPLVYPLLNDRVLVTPEGRASLHVLEHALRSATVEAVLIFLDGRERDATEEILMCTYGRWLRQRLDAVSGLLASETSTLRPAAAGLLLTLLVNRNTAPERALPRPRDRTKRSAIEDAFRAPALAWSSTFTGRAARPEAFDLYRGWAVGELARRLGSGLHLDFEDAGIFIAEDQVTPAFDRILADLARRPGRLRARIPLAWEALLAAYREVRPRLVAMGISHERASFTKLLANELLALVEI